MASGVMATEMAEQPQVLQRLIAARAAIGDEIRRIAPADLSGVVLFARGSSDNAAQFGRYVLERRIGRPVSLAAPSILTRYGTPMDYSGFLVVALSQSGATPEIVAAAEYARDHGARVLAVTNDPSSPLTVAGDICLLTGAGTERAVPATKTVTAQMLVLALVGRALARHPVPEDELAGVVEGVEWCLDDPYGVDRVVAALDGVQNLILTGRGPALAAAMEGALKLRETCGVVAEGISVADLMHGPIAAVGPRTVVLTIDLGGPVRADIDALTERLAGRATHLRCSASSVADLRLPPGLAETAGAVVATVRLQQVALGLAHLLDRDPDAPPGLTKVTPTH